MLNVTSYHNPPLVVEVEKLGDGLVKSGTFANTYPLHTQGIHKAIVTGLVTEPGVYGISIVDGRCVITNDKSSIEFDLED